MTVLTPFSMRNAVALALAVAAGALALAASASARPATGCSLCGKNLIKNPGAEAGRGQTAPGETGNVPHWTSVAGQFGAASYTGFGSAWFSAASAGPKDKGKNYFFGGTTPAATSAKATIGQQVIALPAAAAHHKATLSGWLGNYGTDRASVRAQFADATGKILSTVRIGPDTTIGGENMASRSRSGSVPAGARTVTIVVTFTEHDAEYNYAGADDLSLVLT